MMTVRQIERLWTANSQEKLLDSLLRGRWEAAFGERLCASPAVTAAALGMIRLDELSQSDAPVFGVLLRTILATQESDGGWGDLPATAWSLRALLIDGGSGVAVERGMTYLGGLQQAAGIWPAIPIRRMPADPLVSAFILCQLGDSGRFRRRVRFAEAVGWFEANSELLDEETRAIWSRAKLHCRPMATSGAGQMEDRAWRPEAGDGIRTHDVSLGKAAFCH
jgi:hypothetical protein